MEESNKNIENEEIYIDFRKYIGIFKRHRKLVLKIVCAAFVIGIGIALCIPRQYTVVTKIAPELSPSVTSRLGMSSLMGMSNTLMGTTDAVYPMVYPDLISSPDFISGLFSIPVSFVYKKQKIDTTLYAYMLNYRQSNPLSMVLGLPKRALSQLIMLFSEDDFTETRDTLDSFNFTKEQGRIMTTLSRSIKAETDKKTMALTIKVTLPDKFVCATVSKAIAEHLKKSVSEYRTSKAVDDCEYYKKMLDEAKIAYYEAQSLYSRYVDSHQNFSGRSYMVETYRLKNEANLAYQLYTSMAQQYQSAKARVQQDTPVFAEVIKPTVPLKSSNSKKTIVLAVTFLGFLAAVAYIFIKYRKEEA